MGKTKFQEGRIWGGGGGRIGLENIELGLKPAGVGFKNIELGYERFYIALLCSAK